jgi:hypothetical protein
MKSDIIGYGPGNVPIVQEDLDHIQKWIEIYEIKASDFEAKAAKVSPRKRGAYASHATQNHKNAELMRQNLAALKLYIGNPWKLGQ